MAEIRDRILGDMIGAIMQEELEAALGFVSLASVGRPEATSGYVIVPRQH